MNKPLVVSASFFVLLIIGYLAYQNHMLRNDLMRMEARIGQAMQTEPADKSGKGAQDPYVAREIKNTVVKNAKSLQECWLEFLKTDPPVKRGSVYLDWTVQTDGVPQSVEVIRSDFGNEAMNQCLMSKIKAFTFPPPPWNESKYVEYTLSFEREEDPKPKIEPELVLTKNPKEETKK
ncbi:MAG: hypothetical protein COT74_12755 [Bdellovibrionales bacterium CG10_big_fil_rev_8_21_14_0_10_45_34]|nr:MAG: hypothetical protein COT74_12755 [Bdellovibrionales bacterium CG10_big_fil_rev_8_21_14_0_10_45_34]